MNILINNAFDYFAKLTKLNNLISAEKDHSKEILLIVNDRSDELEICKELQQYEKINLDRIKVAYVNNYEVLYSMMVYFYSCEMWEKFSQIIIFRLDFYLGSDKVAL